VLAVLLRVSVVPRFGLLFLLTAAAACTGLPPAAVNEGQVLPPIGQSGVAAAPAATRSVLPNARDSVKFLVIGDSGTGDRNQREVAARIVEARERCPFPIALMLGDNLYGGSNAAAYRSKFELPYAALLEAGVKFYASLGNHDNASQRFYTGFNMDGKRYYSHDTGDVRFFALDSTYMNAEQLKWLENELSRSTHKWKIAYMHHPMYSSGLRHGATVPLRSAAEPLFLKYGVDVVFAGHEHFYERMRPQGGITYVIQGGSAKLRRGNIRKNSEITAAGFDTDRSFTLAEIVGDRMYLETISRMGVIVDATVITRREAVDSSPSD
jgi:hypothetical protein